MRAVLHVDMDSFFSAIEQRESSELRGRPVVVGADPKGGKGRGVVSAASYEAREHGVHSGQPISRAYRLCPHCIFLPVRHRLYLRVSGRIMEILKRHADKIQQVSIDEAYLEVSRRVKGYSQAKELARRIKAEVYERERLTCSIGIAPNKMLAKIASDQQKPDGLTVVLEEVEAFLAPLDVGRVPGIGPRSREVLRGMGIGKLAELASTDVQRLLPYFGRWSHRLVELARGIDDREVEEKGRIKSVGRERTFQEDTDDEAQLEAMVEKIAELVHRDLVEEGFLFRTLTLKVRYSTFETRTRAKTLRNFNSDLSKVKNLALQLFDSFPKRKVRLLGIRLSNLKRRQKVTLEDYL